MQRWQRLLITGLVTSILSANAWSQSFNSGPAQTILIELYTSQGCSSCPPAEQYLNSLKNDPLLWKKYIPLAFHVDYWDYIGWKDQFALATNTLRQRQYAKVNSQRSIYTPAFFINGKPWRYRFYNRKPDTRQHDSGILKVNLSGNKLTASFSPVFKSAEDLILNVAIAGMGFSIDIEAGEREGSRPRHEFILLNLTQYRSTDMTWSAVLPSFDNKGAGQLALVAWVSRQGDPTPIQSLGGYIK
jgi:hypothetical protein